MKKILVILICLLLCSCEAKTFNHNYDDIHEIDYSSAKTFDFDIRSNEYMLVNLSEFKVEYCKDNDLRIYPASLTKLMTLDTVLNTFDDLSATSSISNEQIIDLINQDASLASLQADYEYTLYDLLYGLMLPSGADAAIALENYFIENNLNLMEQMKLQLDKLNCNDTNFVNSTGLHDDNHYTTLNDLLKILLDVLSFESGRTILETVNYLSEDHILFRSALQLINVDGVKVLGGKTGYTDESGQSVIVLYKANNRSYALLLANAMADSYYKQRYHIDDAMEIMKQLY
jgi:serine-type D-Ala-D-Ala carboxypeptidase (penicillin-binding protein 5/6)